MDKNTHDDILIEAGGYFSLEELQLLTETLNRARIDAPMFSVLTKAIDRVNDKVINLMSYYEV